jgi:hypothetical protein
MSAKTLRATLVDAHEAGRQGADEQPLLAPWRGLARQAVWFAYCAGRAQAQGRDTDALKQVILAHRACARALAG